MEAEVGSFVFIDDKFFKDFPDEKLMLNSEGGTKRPCYYIADTKSGIYWVIPISSRVEKYEKVYENMLNRNGRCDTLAFGELNGEMKAFLIQNMFPVKEEYIVGIYMLDQKPVRINEKVQKEIRSKAGRILSLERKGHRVLFPDSLLIERKLLHQLGLNKPLAVKPQARGAPPRSKPPNQLG